MKLDPRFLFHGSAVAVGGHLLRPVGLPLEPGCAASLPARGGRSTSQQSSGNVGGMVTFGPASAHVEGVFDDVHRAIELTYGRVDERALTTTTRVTAAVEAVVIAGTPPLSVKRLRGTLVSTSADGGNETPILITDDTVVEGVTIAGHVLQVDLDLPLFRRLSTHASLIAAAGDSEFVRDHSACFSFPSRGAIHATIVKSLHWAGAPFPGADLDQHSVTVPNLGRIFFGEVMIAQSTRRLTMMRVELGSKAGGRGGHMAFADIDAGGVWYPPPAHTSESP